MINRSEFLQQLESVQPGLAPKKGIMEQSKCFVFEKGTLKTFNGEICCKCKSVEELHGAVRADKILEVLRMMTDKEIDLIQSDKKLTIKGKNKRTTLAIDPEILLDTSHVEKPGEWHKLEKDFVEAVEMCNSCTSSKVYDEMFFKLTFIHITPKYMEASDNIQMVRYRQRVPIKAPILIRGSSLRQVSLLSPVHISDGEDWVHFRNDEGAVISTQKYVFEKPYPNNTPELKVRGEKIVFPKSTAMAASLSSIFSSETDLNLITVKLKNDVALIVGKGMSGMHEQKQKVVYSGFPMKFQISAKILSDLLKEHTEYEITENRLKIRNDRYVYIACLGADT